MSDWVNQMINFATSQATRIAKNYASELFVASVVSADKDGQNASIKWNGKTIGSELIYQTPFTIENVISIPEQETPRHDHDITSDLTDCTGITSTGESVFFIPQGVNIESAIDPSTGMVDPSAVANIADITTLSIKHDHGGKVSKELPEIRLWRGVKAGDSVLVLKVNPNTFVILCPLTMPNDQGTVDVTRY